MEKFSKSLTGKLKWHLLPLYLLKPVIKILEDGAEEYGYGNWKQGNIEHYVDAMQRHFVEYQAGKLKDKRSKFSHMAHIICNAIFILYFEQNAEKRKEYIRKRL